MRSRSATRRRIGHLVVLVAMLLAPTHALAQSDAPETPGTEGAPDIIGVGHGSGLGQCFVELHLDGEWPPPETVTRWVLELTMQDENGATTIRSHASHDVDSVDLVGRNPQRRVQVEEVAVADGVVAFKWGCGVLPRTAAVRFDVTDAQGRTLLRDEVAPHGFSQEVRAPGEVPDAELVEDPKGDLVNPTAQLETEQVTRELGGGTSTSGGLLILALVVLMGFVGYLVWSGPGDLTVD
jgi:hypothetical protein